MSDYILSCKGVCKSFGGVHALQNVDLNVKRGEVHCLAGENGCGKSTIIKAISGFQPQDSGTIEFDGKSYDALNPSLSIDLGIQVIYQDLSVFPNLTVQENLAINTVLSNKEKIYSRRKQREIAEKVMKTLDLNLVRVSNDHAPGTDISWYFDDEPVSGKVTFTRAGRHTLEARFTTVAGRRKIVELEITVE